jgi:CTP:molybdopterin cytidylyltransferase MocA
MGQPKGLLQLDGQSFLRHVVRTLAEGGCDPVVVVVAEGDQEGLDEAESSGAMVLTNSDPGEGPITSLRLAIERLRGSIEAIAFLPVDHPRVQAGTVVTLLAAARETEADLAVPVYRSKRGHPAVFGAALFDELTDPELEGGARTVVHRHLNTALLVDVQDAGVIADVDTPADYAALTRNAAVTEDTR